MCAFSIGKMTPYNFTIFGAVKIKPLILFLVSFLGLIHLNAQTRVATVEGTLKNKSGQVVEAASISVNGKGSGSISNRKGFFSIEVPADSNISLIVTHISFEPVELKLNLKEGEKKTVSLTLIPSAYDLDEIEVEEEKNRAKPMESIDPKNIKYIPSPNGSFEAVIKTLPGVY